MRFGEDYDGLRVHVRDLDAPNTMSDPILHGYAQRFLGSIETGQRPTTLDRVRELVELLLPTGRCSIEHVARSHGVDRRTVHRRLANEGHTFTSVVDATRDLAARLVRGHNRPLTEVAEMIWFSSHSSFTRWFRSRFGCGPSQWRRPELALQQHLHDPGQHRLQRCRLRLRPRPWLDDRPARVLSPDNGGCVEVGAVRASSVAVAVVQRTRCDQLVDVPGAGQRHHHRRRRPLEEHHLAATTAASQRVGAVNTLWV